MGHRARVAAAAHCCLLGQRSLPQVPKLQTHTSAYLIHKLDFNVQLCVGHDKLCIRLACCATFSPHPPLPMRPACRAGSVEGWPRPISAAEAVLRWEAEAEQRRQR